MGERFLVALGGNALLRPGQKGWASEQLETLKGTVRTLADLIAAGHQLVLTHGNGPQVGNLMIQQHLAREAVPPWPMDLCVAATQGVIGAMIQDRKSTRLNSSHVKNLVCRLLLEKKKKRGRDHVRRDDI